MRGRPPDERHGVRRTRAEALLEDMRVWLEATLRQASERSDLSMAIRKALTRWPAPTRYFDDGRVEIDNNPIVLGRTNWLCSQARTSAEFAPR